MRSEVPVTPWSERPSSVFPAVVFLQESPPGLLTQCEVDETALSRRRTQTLHRRHPEGWSSDVPGPQQLFVLKGH